MDKPERAVEAVPNQVTEFCDYLRHEVQPEKYPQVIDYIFSQCMGIVSENAEGAQLASEQRNRERDALSELFSTPKSITK